MTPWRSTLSPSMLLAMLVKGATEVTTFSFRPARLTGVTGGMRGAAWHTVDGSAEVTADPVVLPELLVGLLLAQPAITSATDTMTGHLQPGCILGRCYLRTARKS